MDFDHIEQRLNRVIPHSLIIITATVHNITKDHAKENNA